MSAEFARLVTPHELPGLEFMHAHFSGQTFVPHSHSYLSITLILEGRWLSCHSGTPHTAESGQIGIVNYEEIHDGMSQDPAGSTYLKLAIGTELLQEVGSLCGSTDRWIPIFTEPVIRDDELADRLLNRYHEFDNDPDRVNRSSEILDLVMAFIKRHASSWRDDSLILPEHHAIQCCLDFINRHYFEDIRLTDLAEATGMSRYHLIRVFRDTTGLTPHAYITQIRLEQAQQLLSSGSPIRDVATTCGFVDQSHFTHRFKQLYGFTPGEYVRVHTSKS